MNEFNTKNEKTFREVIYVNDDAKSCSVCFSSENCVIDKITGNDLSILDIEILSDWTNIIPDNILVKSCCGIHYICIGCLRKLVNNYENHSINESNSHISCPYPFKECVNDMGYKNIFDHNVIKKICKSEQEWNDYIIHAERYAFPGFTIVKCPVLHYRGRYIDREVCNADILLENNLIKSSPIGDLILLCDQNEFCLKKSCFHCKKQLNYYHDSCYECKSIHENENPNLFNYYFNKNYENQLANVSSNQNESSDSDSSSSITLNYQESSYLYLNKEIDSDIAFNQIMSVINNIDTYMICPICKISLYKTEKCNGLSHHNIERCYACGRIGYMVKGLGGHWNSYGESGCFRFNSDSYIRTYIPQYNCHDDFCHSHEQGDCKIEDHQPGIQSLEILRKRAYVYHMIKSLLPDIRFIVYDRLYDELKNKDLLQFLPYKQTFILLTVYKNHNIDYSEEIVYKRLKCHHPKTSNIFETKNFTIPPNEYIETYSLNKPTVETTNNEYYINLPEFTNNLLDEILNELNQEINNNPRTNTPENTPENTTDNSLENIINNIRNDNDSVTQEDTQEDVSSGTNTIQIINNVTNTTRQQYIETQHLLTENTHHTHTYRYINLPTLTLNTYSLLVDYDNETHTDFNENTNIGIHTPLLNTIYYSETDTDNDTEFTNDTDVD